MNRTNVNDRTVNQTNVAHTALKKQSKSRAKRSEAPANSPEKPSMDKGNGQQDQGH